MDRRKAAGMLATLPLLTVAGRVLAQQQPAAQQPAQHPERGRGRAKQENEERERHEEGEHPRIAKAIDALQDAIAYMQAAPHDFGGHKVQAIESSRAAIAQLRLALAYRAAHT